MHLNNIDRDKIRKQGRWSFFLPTFTLFALGAADAMVAAIGLVHFAPSTVRKLLRASDTPALPQARTSITTSVWRGFQTNGQQGGCTLARAEETWAAEALFSRPSRSCHSCYKCIGDGCWSSTSRLFGRTKIEVACTIK
jgi:hypothetical protein